MSYDLRLVDHVSRETLHAPAPHWIAGGTYVAGGTTELWLNVTWNYAPILRKVLGPEGIRGIYGKTGAEVLPILITASKELHGKADPDYWRCTEGNVKAALLQLIALSQIRPDGVWDGD